MSKVGRFLRSTLVWTYDRGTLQYDILCALILAFIFLVPRSCFEPRKTELPQAQGQETADPSVAAGAGAAGSQKPRN